MRSVAQCAALLGEPSGVADGEIPEHVLDVLVHRGPDATAILHLASAGSTAGDGVGFSFALAHTRPAIVDFSRAADNRLSMRSGLHFSSSTARYTTLRNFGRFVLELVRWAIRLPDRLLVRRWRGKVVPQTSAARVSR
jgi:hypothetical protein